MARTRKSLTTVDPVWTRITEEAEDAVRAEPLVPGVELVQIGGKRGAAAAQVDHANRPIEPLAVSMAASSPSRRTKPPTPNCWPREAGNAA